MFDGHLAVVFLLFGIRRWKRRGNVLWCCGLKVIFMVGNKSDLDGQRDVTFDEAKQFAEENGMCRGFFGFYFIVSFLSCRLARLNVHSS